jgi:hypothetical protein
VKLRLPLLMWIGVVAAPIAWFTQFAVGQYLSLVSCTPGGAGISPHSWTLPATVVGALVAIVGALCAFATFRATRDVDRDDDPPSGRIHFMGIVGMVTSPIFLFVILMGGLGALELSGCR